MSYNSENLMAYLYNELSEKERKEVEQLIETNEEARKELKELKDTMQIMGSLKDKEITAPNFTFQESSDVIIGSKSRSIWTKYMAIAASVALILVSGFLTNFHISYNENGIELAFGSSNEYNQDQVERLIADAIQKNNKGVEEKIASAEADIRRQVSEYSHTVEQNLISRVNQTDFEGEKRKYLAELRQMLESSELAQRKYTDEVLTDFAIFLDIQRQNDMNVIQTRFENLQDDAELNQFQTNQLLTNLISTVDEPNQY